MRLARPAARILEHLGCAILTGVVWGGAAALVEGAALALFSSDPPAAEDWAYALLLNACFGALLALAGAALLLPLERRWPGVTGAALPPAVAAALAAVVGGMWLNQWSAMPPFTTPAGIAVNAVILGACLLGALLLVGYRSGRRRVEPMPRRAATGWGLGTVLAAFALVPVAGSWLRPDPPVPGPEAPPVVVVTIDTLRRDHLGCYGYDRPTSPNIDALAHEAIVFDQSVTSGNFTVPSIASLFTGSTPSEHGVTRLIHRIRADQPTLAEVFRGAGYRTGAFVANPILRPAAGFTRGFGQFEPTPPPGWVRHRTTALERAAARLREGGPPGRAADLVPAALAWLRRPAERPPFLYLHLLEPHSPYEPPERHARPFLAEGVPVGSMNPPNIWDWREVGTFASFEDFPDGPEVDAATRRRMVGLYDGEIHQVDEWLGKFFAGLREGGTYDRALIVLLADHGEEFADHGGWFHGLTVYQEMVAMPLVVKLPGNASAGSRSDLPLDMVDVAATVCALAGLDPAWTGGGENFAAALRSNDSSVPIVRSFVERPPVLYGLRVGRWKLVRRVRDGVPSDRLFDLAEDPRERLDLSAARTDTLLSLQLQLGSLLEGLDGARSAGRAGPLDAASRRALRALGYTN